MTDQFEAKHPRGMTGQFAEKPHTDPGAGVLPAPPGLDDVVEFKGPLSFDDQMRKVGGRVRTLIENGRWAVRQYNEITGDVTVHPAGSGDLAHAIPHAIPGIAVLEQDTHWTDYANHGHLTFRVYNPVTEPLPHCAGGCGRRMLPDDHDYWSGNDGEDRYCDSSSCGADDPDMYPRDEPVDALDNAVTPWWENH